MRERWGADQLSGDAEAQHLYLFSVLLIQIVIASFLYLITQIGTFSYYMIRRDTFVIRLQPC
jgi:hypothetical protein